MVALRPRRGPLYIVASHGIAVGTDDASLSFAYPTVRFLSVEAIVDNTY